MDIVLAKVTAIAFLVEVLTNMVKSLVPNLDKRHITLVAGVLGVLVAAITRTGVLHALEIPVQFDYVDYFITGVLISRGANIVHDLAKTLNVAS
ncbi:MAG: hypothetical protein GX195_08660 [Firmicutes bacterium]|jgi:deoxyhypusine synthase|nr:hypothetical protein [Bacillota bacterium]